MKSLSEKRIRLLHLLAESQRKGEFPLVRELASRLNLAGRTSITQMLASLENEGYIMRHGGGEERRQCIYRLTKKGEAVAPIRIERLRIPVLGSIPAGPVAEAIQDCDEFVDPGDLLRVQSSDFFLRVEGDSMTGDNIMHGDLVQLRPGVQISTGAIAAVQIKQANGQYDSTLKHIHFQPGRKMVRLKASNPAYEDIIISAKDVEIAGVYKGLIRRAE